SPNRLEAQVMPTHTLCSRNKSSAKSNAARSFLTCAFRPTKPAAIVRAGRLITVWLEVRVLPGSPRFPEISWRLSKGSWFDSSACLARSLSPLSHGMPPVGGLFYWQLVSARAQFDLSAVSAPVSLHQNSRFPKPETRFAETRFDTSSYCEGNPSISY